MGYDHTFKVGDRLIGRHEPAYFIADIGANHDGNLDRARSLIHMAAESGADCVKFQHFQASKIVSAVGFEGMRSAHQRNWDKSVFEVYQDYSINPDWNQTLADTAKDAGIDFMTTPYDIESVASVRHLVKAYKIGSGDITYHELIDYVAGRMLPVFLATGASTMQEVEAAVAVSLRYNSKLCLMQCNTNYTGSLENFHHVNLEVLTAYAKRWPLLPLGLSDHTPGYVCVLGAVALGARVIEKHFTDDKTRKGPDHSFALEPGVWNSMVMETRLLEQAIGNGIKLVEYNENESRIVQRRAIRMRDGWMAGKIVTPEMVEFLRPCPHGAFTPAQIDAVVGHRLLRSIAAGQEIYPQDIET